MKIQEIGVIGSGLMGSGIAQVIAQAGYQVILVDNNQDQLAKAEKSINKSLNKLVEKEKLTRPQVKKTLNNLSFSNSISKLTSTDLVIEAISESLAAKSGLFSELTKIVKPEAILASNTSSISISKLATSSNRSSQFIGIHFFNPAPLMPLVEIIPGKDTSDLVVTLIKDFITSLNKTGILAKDSPGFIVNRILCPMINEAVALFAEGNKPDDIDQAMQLGANHPMGPLALADYVGLDTLVAILEIYQEEFNDNKYAPHPLLKEYVNQGNFGRKSGQGFYRYE